MNKHLVDRFEFRSSCGIYFTTERKATIQQEYFAADNGNTPRGGGGGI
jgi:hypothetical protein